MFKHSIFSDGGARGNPGPSAAAFVFFDESHKVIHKESKFLGDRTNNYAEYQGVLLALNWILKNESLVKGDINFFMDSELVVKQINGLYKVKEPTLKSLHQNVKESLQKISVKVVFQNILREKNSVADSLVNEELDKSSS
ncbi:MAG: ribonuclease HI family protein [Microgenomates group bacterium]